MIAAITKGRGAAAVAVVAVVLGVLTGYEPALGAIFVLAALFAGAFFIVERALLPVVSLGILLLVPLDFIGPFAEELRGLPVLGVALGGALLSLLSPRRPLGQLVRSGWDVAVFSAAVLLAFGINGVEGGVRQAVMLVAGVLFYFWVRASHKLGTDVRPQFLRMLLYVGIVQGVAALFERLIGPSTFALLLPSYAPAFKDFSLALGSRATAFAGHPLRLGALEMSALIAGIGLMRGTQGRDRVVASVSIAVCALGLLLSGARGAWLGALVGAFSLLVITPGFESHKIALRLGVVSVAGWIVIDSLGVVAIIQERLFGAASRPASLAQRVGVLASTVEIWRERPLLGYGFGTYLDEIYAQGFRYSNTENEYVNFVLSGGMVSLVSVAIMGIRGVVLVWRTRRALLVPAMGGVLVAWLVNIGTFNAFSWSAAFPLFMTTLAVIADGADE